MYSLIIPLSHPPTLQRCDGLAACENCVRRGYACHYSQRRRTGPKIRTAADEHPEWRAAATPNGLVPWLSNTIGSAASAAVTCAGPNVGSGGSSTSLGMGKSHSSNNSLSSNSSGGGSTVGHVLQKAQFPPPPTHFGYKQEGEGRGGGGLGVGRGTNMFHSIQISPASLLPAPSSSQQQPPQQAGSANGGGGDAMPPLAPNLYAHLHQEGASSTPMIGSCEEKFMNVFLAELNAFLPIADKDMLLSSLANLRANGKHALPPSTLIPLLASLPPQTTESLQEVQLQNAHNAMVWAGIAIGAMLQGETGNMERYTTLAWLSMKECFDFPSPATVSAYLMMAFVYMMFGELDRFRRYCSMAEGIASALGPTLSNEMEVTLLYVRVGQNPDGE